MGAFLLLLACEPGTIHLPAADVRTRDTDTGGQLDTGDTDTATETGETHETGDTGQPDQKIDTSADTVELDTAASVPDPDCTDAGLGLTGLEERIDAGMMDEVGGCLGRLEITCDAPQTASLTGSALEGVGTLTITYDVSGEPTGTLRYCAVQGYATVEGTTVYWGLIVSVVAP